MGVGEDACVIVGGLLLCVYFALFLPLLVCGYELWFRAKIKFALSNENISIIL